MRAEVRWVRAYAGANGDRSAAVYSQYAAQDRAAQAATPVTRIFRLTFSSQNTPYYATTIEISEKIAHVVYPNYSIVLHNTTKSR